MVEFQIAAGTYLGGAIRGACWKFVALGRELTWGSTVDHCIRFFSIHIRNYINKLPIDKLLYNTTRTIQGGAKYPDYRLAFKVPVWSKTK